MADQRQKNVGVIPDDSGEFTCKMGMLVDKGNLGFGIRSSRHTAIVNDGVVVVEIWFERPGLVDNYPEVLHGVSSSEN